MKRGKVRTKIQNEHCHLMLKCFISSLITLLCAIPLPQNHLIVVLVTNDADRISKTVKAIIVRLCFAGKWDDAFLWDNFPSVSSIFHVILCAKSLGL